MFVFTVDIRVSKGLLKDLGEFSEGGEHLLRVIVHVVGVMFIGEIVVKVRLGPGRSWPIQISDGREYLVRPISQVRSLVFEV